MCLHGDVCLCVCWVCLTWHDSMCVMMCVGVGVNLGHRLSMGRKEGKERKGAESGR